MKDLHINNKIFLMSYLFLLSIFCFSEESIEKRLEINIDRIKIENYFLENICKKDNAIVPVVIVYCYDGYYSLYDTKMKYTTLETRRYFFDYKVDKGISKLSTDIADKNMNLDDFINQYLVKNDDKSYSISYKNYDIFTPKNNFLSSIFFAAQYSYNFLILIEHGYSPTITLYLPDSYENVKKKYNIFFN
ncbi:hypothetical protein [Treponema pedis]|uniref:Uncharacterized protein n=1 Tax=Treponema pedis TaxID=409322 RepID=A0A7S7AX65_9SPIR|nr:hypothetical protein [Treponema pedis]QOW61642.1 hypothetical protein IFE08_04500 [Treponema pedis]